MFRVYMSFVEHPGVFRGSPRGVIVSALQNVLPVVRLWVLRKDVPDLFTTFKTQAGVGRVWGNTRGVTATPF